jgi:tyrosine-protein kinase Etk/Wzc
MPETVMNPTPENGEVHFLDYLISLAKHSRMIIFASVAVTVLVYIYLFCSPNTYKATARLLPPQQNLTLSAQLLDSLGARVSPGGGAGLGMGGMASNLLGLKSSGDIYVAMMTSEAVFDPIIARFHLKKLYKDKYLEDARKTLSKNVRITAGKKDSILVIEVTCTTPQMAAQMANAFIEELDRLLKHLSLEEAKARMAFLEKERLQASQNLAKVEESLRHFREKNSLLQIDTQTKGTIEYIARLRAEIDTKAVSIQVLRQQATPLNYDVVRAETEIKGLKEKLLSAESQLENCLSDFCLPAKKTPGVGLEYLRLFREAKFQEHRYELYTKLVEVARLDIVRDVAVVQVLTLSTPPERRSNKRLFPSILAGMLTFFMMIIVAFGVEYIQCLNNRGDEAHRLTVLKGYLTPWTNIMKRMQNIIWFKRKF